jgi:hypothetical protein
MDLRGNESGAARVPLSVRNPHPPDEPVVAGWDPGQRIWATSAAIFKEGAAFAVSWTATAGAVRYEVWRVLDEGLPGAIGAPNDQDRRAIATAHPDAFTLRSGLVFATNYVDELPGRAPTRAYYRIRAIGLNGATGAMSAVIGPVYVPDVRRPPAPNFLRANALPPAEHDRAVVLEWTQPGDTAGIRFDIEWRVKGNDAFASAGPAGAGSATPATGIFRFVHEERTPGRTYEYRVRAYRDVADPIDPSGVATRSIASTPSKMLSVKAVSLAKLRAPAAFTAASDATTGLVVLTWTNRDIYESISIRRRAADKPVFQLVATIAGDSATFTDATATTGTWRYQVRAHRAGVDVRSDDAEAEVP